MLCHFVTFEKNSREKLALMMIVPDAQRAVVSGLKNKVQPAAKIANGRAADITICV
jgi:hypothetical protein